MSTPTNNNRPTSLLPVIRRDAAGDLSVQTRFPGRVEIKDSKITSSSSHFGRLVVFEDQDGAINKDNLGAFERIGIDENGNGRIDENEYFNLGDGQRKLNELAEAHRASAPKPHKEAIRSDGQPGAVIRRAEGQPSITVLNRGQTVIIDKNKNGQVDEGETFTGNDVGPALASTLRLPQVSNQRNHLTVDLPYAGIVAENKADKVVEVASGQFGPHTSFFYNNDEYGRNLGMIGIWHDRDGDGKKVEQNDKGQWETFTGRQREMQIGLEVLARSELSADLRTLPLLGADITPEQANPRPPAKK
jgi:hypothetical protein